MDAKHAKEKKKEKEKDKEKEKKNMKNGIKLQVMQKGRHDSIESHLPLSFNL